MFKIVSYFKSSCHFKGVTRCLPSRISNLQSRRHMLSDTFKCQESWDRRLQAPIIQNIKLEDMYYELDQKFQQNGVASVIDIDLFANAITEETHLEELEDVMHKLRLSSNTGDMLQSTPHAFIRLFLALGKELELLEILNDRLNYGIFPDDFCSSILMDTFIKNKDYTGAAKVSVLQMLQEDWNNPLVTHLALYSCHMFLKEPVEWGESESGQDEVDDGEEVKVRVKFLKNPFFDDHFDLRKPNHLVGKTLAALTTPMADTVGRTYNVIGLILYEKWDECKSLLQQYVAKGLDIFKEGITFIQTIVEKPSGESSSEGARENVLALLQELVTKNLAIEGDLHKAVVDKVQRVVKEQERDVVNNQKEVYQSWEKHRLEALQKQIEALRVKQRLARVQEEKFQLAEKEKELFFFDNEDKWDLVIESKRVFYPKKYFGKKKKKRVKDEGYVPPEV